MSATGNHSLFLVEAKKSPQLWPRGKVGWWRKSTKTQKLHEFIEFIQEIVVQCAALNRLSALTKTASSFDLLKLRVSVCWPSPAIAGPYINNDVPFSTVFEAKL
jgi:hypothetical protein